MSTYKDLESVRPLSGKRGDTNSAVELVKIKDTDQYFVRKIIYGIDQPLYQAIFTREIRALYKLNKCENIVKILGDDYLKVKSTNERVGVIYLEFINGIELGKAQIENFSSKDKFSIINQLFCAIEISHSNGIIHRDINPNNIMISEEGNVKVIDFGICKINDMINSATVYKMGTTAYSAPEVHQHSENATEQSDLYSLGSVIYFLFTGKQPPLAIQFQQVLDETRGMDIALKPILKKLVEIDPQLRYQDIFELKKDFLKLFTRFLDLDKTVLLTASYENISDLKRKRLIPSSISMKTACEDNLPNNFMELHMFIRDEDQNKYFIFLGSNYLAECLFDDEQNVFDVIEFKKLKPIDREVLKRKFTKVEAKVKFVDKKFAHRESKNNSLEISNVIIDYYNEYISNHNVDSEYRNKYGVWRDLLELVKQDIEKNVVRLPYDKYELKENIIKITLKTGVFIDEDRLNKEQCFVYEKSNRKNKEKTKPVLIGSYENDYYEKGHVILEIIKSGFQSLPGSGEICLDYRKDLSNVTRQLDALNTIEKEDYQCSFSLKRIISGVELPDTNLITKEVTFFNEQLDLPQQTAVKKALSADSMAIIQGPPGTGKTNVIIEIILQILKDNRRNPDVEPKKVLLVSQSHPAVDKMLEDLIKASDKRPDMLRIGRDDKLNESIREQYSVNDVKEHWKHQVRNNCSQYMKNVLKDFNLETEEFNEYYSILEKDKIENEALKQEEKTLIEDFETKTCGKKGDRIREILKIQKNWMEQLNQCDESELYIIKSTIIIAGTCIGFASNKIIKDVQFDYVIVDEAAKATFPELAVSLNKAHKIILVGDHQQLPPVLDTEVIKSNSDKIDERSLSEGIFEKLYNIFPGDNKHRLTIQYRMHPVIGTLISHVFYEDEIQNGVEDIERSLNIDDYENTAIEWIDTSIYSNKERFEHIVENGGKKSFENYLEVKLIKKKLIELDKKIFEKTKVAIITGYSPQKYKLQGMLKQLTLHHLEVEIDTVDAFQGSQKDIIIYSTVRSSGNRWGIGFLKSEARINVAFSRARCLLIIVGDMKFLNNKKIRGNKFPEIIEYIESTAECRIIRQREETK